MDPLENAAGDDHYYLEYEWLLPSSNSEGFKIVDKVVEKIKSMIMQRDTEATFTPEELENLLPRDLCSLVVGEDQDEKMVEARIFYCRFINAFLQSIVQLVLPSLRDKEFLSFFPDLKMWWNKYKQMADILVPLFRPLVTAYPDLTNIGVQLETVPMNIFCDMVLDLLWAPAPEIVTLMIKQEREGQVINQGLLKEIVDFAIEVEKFGNRPYYADVEQAILEDATSYDSMLSSEWLSANYSFGGYLEKVEQWSQQEKILKEHYLPDSTVQKLLGVAASELYDNVAREVANLIPEKGVGIRLRRRIG